jgi:hypothetical protein
MGDDRGLGHALDEEFFTHDLHVGGSGDTEADGVALDGQHLDDDAQSGKNDSLVVSGGQDQDEWPPFLVDERGKAVT